MPKGYSKGYDGATKGEHMMGGTAHRPTHVPTPTNPMMNRKLENKMPANHNSGIGRLQAYKKGKRGGGY